jgi:NAD(P)-dependent dehydrogenase (short-subunit alcohol dehydrogenase family)
VSGSPGPAPAAGPGGGRLDGKTVLITGAGSGLGRESALLFAAEGANVVVTDLVPARVDRVVAEVRAAGGEAVGAKADVRQARDTIDAVALAVQTYGRLDVLMCSAGVPEEGFGTLAFEDISVEGFTSMLATNLTGVFLAARAAVPVMKKQRRGTILAVSSMAGFVAYPGFPGYAAAKHGVNGLVKGMSLSLGVYGIRANALCPAHGMSINFAMPPDADVLGKSYEEMQPWDPAANSIPLKLDRAPNLRDNAYAALYLVCDESAYMSGVCLPATDGGNLARTSIIFPGDLGGDAGVLPDALAQDIHGPGHERDVSRVLPAGEADRQGRSPTRAPRTWAPTDRRSAGRPSGPVTSPSATTNRRPRCVTRAVAAVRRPEAGTPR